MTLQAVLLPLFVHVVLVFVLLVAMAVARNGDFRGGLRWQDIALGEPNWSANSTPFAKAFSNQFELPVLFYVLTILAWMTKQADLLFVVLAWVFVVLRVAQAVVHTTSNHVPTRGAFYGLGALVLILMWLIFMTRILLALG
jgi:hypothetical protein